MSEDLKQLLERMLENHRPHLHRLEQWKATGGSIDNYPEHETIDDFIERERLAIENLKAAIDLLPESYISSFW